MKQLCLKQIACGAYIRVTEDCRTHKNLGLISHSTGECWLWVKREPTDSGAKLYFPKDRSSFRPHKSNADSTPRGGTGHLGGRKFQNLKSIENYLGKIAKFVWC
jgi:hypothetical protein